MVTAFFFFWTPKFIFTQASSNLEQKAMPAKKKQQNRSTPKLARPHQTAVAAATKCHHHSTRTPNEPASPQAAGSSQAGPRHAGAGPTGHRPGKARPRKIRSKANPAEHPAQKHRPRRTQYHLQHSEEMGACSLNCMCRFNLTHRHTYRISGLFMMACAFKKKKKLACTSHSIAC